ncbi:ScbA/BarX family gamma-butyrolactone biosynthesis protein [Saccharothrix coeruleofusca]|uniref:ScbA/BarX family gamma-butyrolactone biosynthesis protein n=1 Tax=Saccharothrix coeruleofusca TaxID=33919 RepID=UPI0027DE1741|nr:ScbA/BarX family gamma-butyrolactone biosynthesis protein [Saccharothrix coeruleofusca]
MLTGRTTLTVAEELPVDPPSRGQVLYDQTVPRHLVHRAAVSEVFLTDLRVIDDTTFSVGAQWPRDHSFYRLPTPHRHDPMLLAETIRQAALVIAHQVFGVPLDWKFMSHETSYQITTAGLALGARPADILLSVTCRDIKRRGNRVAGMGMDITCHRDGRQIGSGSVNWSCVTSAAYQRLRAGKIEQGAVPEEPPPPVAKVQVGRDRSRDVVLSPLDRAGSWLLRVDRHHPVLFDHPVDHVPGMVLHEAARQAAALLINWPGLVPVACRFTFDKYVEFTCPVVVTPVRCAPTTSGALGVGVKIEQDGQTVAHGLMDMRIVD